MITVFIIEDLLDHLNYFKTVINTDHELQYVGDAKTGHEAIRAIAQLQPNIVLIDIGLPDISGIECILRLKPTCPNIKFMVCTIHEENELVFEALKAGANSYILKDSKPYQIIDAIKELHNGGAPLSSTIARKILIELSQNTKELHSTDYNITSKEHDILKLLGRGHSYQEASDLLFISINTFRWHIHNIYKKLHVDNRTEALNKYYNKENIS
jgi:two-component system, NarL family, response regulator LiaR